MEFLSLVTRIEISQIETFLRNGIVSLFHLDIPGKRNLIHRYVRGAALTVGLA